MKDYFLKIDFVFLLLADQGYCLPNYGHSNFTAEYGISHEDFWNENNSDVMEDIMICWKKMTLEEKKSIICMAAGRISDERDMLTKLENGAITIGIELSKWLF